MAYQPHSGMTISGAFVEYIGGLGIVVSICAHNGASLAIGLLVGHIAFDWNRPVRSYIHRKLSGYDARRG